MWNQRTTRYYFLLILVVLIWGLSWPINKIALKSASPIWFATLRLGVAFLCVSLFVIFLKKLRFPQKRDLPMVLTVGLLQVGIFMALINFGLLYVDAGRSAILVYATPLWVMPLAILFFNEQANHLKWIGFCLGMAGVLILFNPLGFNWSLHDPVLGNGILLLASLCWAVSILCVRNMKWYQSPLELLPWQLLAGFVFVLLIALVTQPHPDIHWDMTFIGALAFTGIFGTAFAYWGSIVLSKELPSITVSLYFLGVPVSGLIFASLLLHEKVTFSILIAMISIIGGLIFVALGGRERSS